MTTPTLISLFPDYRDLLALAPEDLGAALLEIIPGISQQAGFTMGAIDAQLYPSFGNRYPVGSNQQVAMAIGEALSWLIIQGLVMHNPTQSAGWYILTRRGVALKTRSDFDAYQKGRALPFDLLQPVLVEKVKNLFLRGDHDTAVFQAFKEVEVGVRAVGGYPDSLVGVALMREAFHPERGKLTDMKVIPAEREAMANLFAGAIGHCKNPTSHRDVKLEREEAAKLIVFASYLFDVVAKRL